MGRGGSGRRKNMLKIRYILYGNVSEVPHYEQ